MGALGDLANGFGVALTPENLFWALVGVTLGTFIGVLPGIGPALTVALLLPVTYELEPVSAFIMFAGIYYGGMYGGSTTSILLNTPGESSSIMTALEGNQMAKRGRGAAALGTAAIGSFVAGTIGTLLLALVAPTVVDLAISLGPAEYFALALLASGQSSTITGTLAGQIVMEGFLDIRLPAWLRRLITRLIAIVPAVIVTALYGERGVGSLLILSQVILSLQLSFAVIPLVQFTGERRKMGPFTNGRLLGAAAWSVAVVIMGLNGWLLVGAFREWSA